MPESSGKSITTGNISGTGINVGDGNTNVVNGPRADLKGLARELATLRAAMKTRPESDEKDIAIGQIAGAEAEAEKGNEPGVMQHLKAAGGWALKIATEIGVNTATAALKSALGI